LEELLHRQPVELRQGADEALLPEAPHRLLPHSVDVRRGHDPVVQGLETAGGARAIRAAVHRLAPGLHDLGAAERAVRRHTERPRSPAMLARRPDDLWDDVARALDDHVVALA